MYFRSYPKQNLTFDMFEKEFCSMGMFLGAVSSSPATNTMDFPYRVRHFRRCKISWCFPKARNRDEENGKRKVFMIEQILVAMVRETSFRDSPWGQPRKGKRLVIFTQVANMTLSCLKTLSIGWNGNEWLPYYNRLTFAVPWYFWTYG